MRAPPRRRPTHFQERTMRGFGYIIAFLSLAGAVAACHLELTEPAAAARAALTGDVTVSRVAGGVTLTNGTGRPVAYAVWNRGWLALFAPCADTGPECPRLPAGASVTVPDRAIDGYDPAMREALVRWWYVVPDGAGGYRADDLHEVVVAL